MSQLIMTLDSDSDDGRDLATNASTTQPNAKLNKQQVKKSNDNKKKNKKSQMAIPNADDEDIQLNKEFQIEDP